MDTVDRDAFNSDSGFSPFRHRVSVNGETCFDAVALYSFCLHLPVLFSSSDTEVIVRAISQDGGRTT
jgi:hypothetical protein